MRVAYICADPGIPVFGQKGCSIHVRAVIRSLQRKGWQVELFVTKLGGLPPSDLENVIVHQLPKSPKGEPAKREMASFSANLELRIALENQKPFDLVYERYSLWSFTAMEYARSLGIPGILEVNAPLIEEQAKYRVLVNRDLAEKVARRVFKAASTIVTVSEEMKTYLYAYPECQGKVEAVPNGVNLERFPLDLKPTLPASPGTFTIGFVGTLEPWHGLPTLVEAFERLYELYPSVRLLIVGDGAERESLKADLLIRGLLSAVQLTGKVPHEEVPGLLASMDVAVAPYPALTDFYFSPLKVYEYMAAGLPIVASDIGQLKTLIENEENGLLCKPGDPIALAKALNRLRRSERERNRLGKAARKTIEQNHTWDAIVTVILDLAMSKYPQCSLDLHRAESGTVIVDGLRGQTQKNKALPLSAAIYARVSSSGQKKQLESQVEGLKQYAAAKGYQVLKVVKEIGSGLDDRRQKLGELLKSDNYSTLIVESKGKLDWFGTGYIEVLLKRLGIALEIVNTTENEPNELMHDLIELNLSLSPRTQRKPSCVGSKKAIALRSK
ncbi:MAG: IS607 family transposase [Prochloraceae cyanobacterium]|nr:IS607 family transposase [Prochloraceae cyanobacterium]